MKEYTKNGIELIYFLNPRGAHFILFPDEHHGPEDIKAAKAELKKDRDVTGIRIANEADRFTHFKREVFKDSRTRPLHWSCIDCEYEVWKAEGKPSPDEFIKNHLKKWQENQKEFNSKPKPNQENQ